jgi:hypothetical protein
MAFPHPPKEAEGSARLTSIPAAFHPLVADGLAAVDDSGQSA